MTNEKLKKYKQKLGKNDEFSLRDLYSKSEAEKQIKKLKSEGHRVVCGKRKEGILVYVGPKMKKADKLKSKEFTPVVQFKEIYDPEKWIRGDLECRDIKNYKYDKFSPEAKAVNDHLVNWFEEHRLDIGEKGVVKKEDAWSFINDSAGEGVGLILDKMEDKIRERIKSEIAYDKMIKTGVKEKWTIDKIRTETEKYNDKYNHFWHPNDTASNIMNEREKQQKKMKKTVK